MRCSNKEGNERLIGVVLYDLSYTLPRHPDILTFEHMLWVVWWFSHGVYVVAKRTALLRTLLHTHICLLLVLRAIIKVVTEPLLFVLWRLVCSLLV